MAKKILGLLVVLMFALSVTVFAGVKEVTAKYDAGDIAGAIADGKVLITKVSGDELIKANNVLGMALRANGEYAEAIKAFQAMGNAKGAIEVAVTQVSSGDNVNAGKSADAAIATYPKDRYIQAYGEYLRGVVANRGGNITEAQALFMDVLVNYQDQVAICEYALPVTKFNKMTPDQADVILLGWYRGITDKVAYANYLSMLVNNMSAKAQATLVK